MARFPFSAIVGQDEMKLALLLVATDPSIGGVMVFGDRGTGKSTAVRALAGLLPPMKAVQGCKYGCDPNANGSRCEECRDRSAQGSYAPLRSQADRGRGRDSCGPFQRKSGDQGGSGESGQPGSTLPWPDDHQGDACRR